VISKRRRRAHAIAQERKQRVDAVIIYCVSYEFFFSPFVSRKQPLRLLISIVSEIRRRERIYIYIYVYIYYCAHVLTRDCLSDLFLFHFFWTLPSSFNSPQTVLLLLYVTLLV